MTTIITSFHGRVCTASNNKYTPDTFTAEQSECVNVDVRRVFNSVNVCGRFTRMLAIDRFVIHANQMCSFLTKTVSTIIRF